MYECISLITYEDYSVHKGFEIKYSSISKNDNTIYHSNFISFQKNDSVSYTSHNYFKTPVTSILFIFICFDTTRTGKLIFTEINILIK